MWTTNKDEGQLEYRSPNLHMNMYYAELAAAYVLEYWVFVDGKAERQTYESYLEDAEDFARKLVEASK